MQLLWDQRDKSERVLLREAYESLGGVAGALTRHADAVLDGFSPQELGVARALLLRLVTPEGTRKVTPREQALEGLDELVPPDVRATMQSQSIPESPSKRVLTRLTEARLVSVTKTVLELTHESLVRSWGTLARWLDESREQMALTRDLSASGTPVGQPRAQRRCAVARRGVERRHAHAEPHGRCRPR